jgi:hypothetical protein
MSKAAACVLVVAWALVGCSSYESTYFISDENGKRTLTTSGVPVVVTVPQKLGFLATETKYSIDTFETSADGTNRRKVGSRIVTETTVDKTPIPLGESKLVNLDIRRPFFGTAKTAMDLTGQYPTKLTSDVDDKTLGRVLDTAEKLVGPLVQRQGAGADEAATKTIIEQRSFMIVYDPATQAITRVKL